MDRQLYSWGYNDCLQLGQSEEQYKDAEQWFKKQPVPVDKMNDKLSKNIQKIEIEEGFIH